MMPTRTRARPFAVTAAFMLVIAVTGSACEPDANTNANTNANIASDPAAKPDQVPEADPLVGYDLRRLRPREDEPLADMFERVRGQALAEQKRVAVLFSADWCEPCRQLDLELGNAHPAALIGHVRVLELKEDDWAAGARMDEFNALRRRWEPVLNTYPLLVLLDDAGARVDEMKEAIERLEAAELEPTLPMWFESIR